MRLVLFMIFVGLSLPVFASGSLNLLGCFDSKNTLVMVSEIYHEVIYPEQPLKFDDIGFLRLRMLSLR